MEICARVYRPRRARESPLFRLVEQHLEEFLHVYPARFAKAQGPLRSVVERVLGAFLTSHPRAMSRRVGCVSGADESRHSHALMPYGGVAWGWKRRSPS